MEKKVKIRAQSNEGWRPVFGNRAHLFIDFRFHFQTKLIMRCNFHKNSAHRLMLIRASISIVYNRHNRSPPYALTNETNLFEIEWIFVFDQFYCLMEYLNVKLIKCDDSKCPHCWISFTNHTDRYVSQLCVKLLHA